MSTTARFASWQLLLLAAGPLLIAGALTHPRVPGMAAMLAHPDWFLSHLVQVLGYGALTAAFVLLRRSGGGPAGRWMHLAVWGAALQTVEAIFHLSAMVDLQRLNAGSVTPVLSTHLFLAAIFYPLFALAMIALIAAGARQRALGSWWIAMLGIMGAALHGVAAIVVVVLGKTQFGFLFAGIALFGLWAVLASLWPARSRAGASAAQLTGEQLAAGH